MKPTNAWPRPMFAASVIAGGVAPVLYYLLWHGMPERLANPAACPLRLTGHFQQGIVLFTAFVVKPAYMMLALAWIIALWRRTAADLVALRWGLMLFLAGEAACAFNYVVLGGDSELWEFLHDYGMVAGFAFVAWAVLEGVDHRLINFSSERARCSALTLCGRCVKQDATVPCGLARVFNVGLWALMAVAGIPWCVPVASTAYTTHINGVPVVYAASAATQWFVVRYCPTIAVALLMASWFALHFRTGHSVVRSKMLLAAALGPLGFGFMRLFLLAAFRDDLVWYTAWEEITELVFVLGVGFVLYVFRRTLFAPAPALGARAVAPVTS